MVKIRAGHGALGEFTTEVHLGACGCQVKFKVKFSSNH